MWPHDNLTGVLLQMLADSGVVAGSGVLLLAACSPVVTSNHLSHPSIATVHTLALCPSTTPLLDQLARPGGAWVLPGPPPSEERPGEETGEQRVAEVLTAATQAALAFPGDPVLTKVMAVLGWLGTVPACASLVSPNLCTH